METALRQGDTLLFPAPPVLAAHAAVGGKKESEGPLAGAFDELSRDNLFGQDNWEAAERALQLRAARLCLQKGHAAEDSVSLALAGDLQAQCTASSYAMRELGIPYAGLFGACSTMAEALGLGAALCAGGMARGVLAMASGHFCAAERQFRTPLCYGAVRTPTAQWTATAAGCAILGREGSGPAVTAVTCGKIVDKGITDANNMGAAMAPAAYDTLSAHFAATGTGPRDYDLVVTGDLGALGHQIVSDLFARDGVDMGGNYTDCGLLLYDRKHQDMHAGASGCGCSASVLNGYLLRKMREGKWKTILFAPTGALLSPTSSGQGESIPSICHAVRLCAVRE